MSSLGRAVGVITAVFAVTGIGLGATGYVATNWATTIFLVNAQGETAVRLGPVFVALVSFIVAVLGFFVGSVLAAVLGVLVGSQFRVPTRAALATGLGGFVGAIVLGLLVLPGVYLGIGAGSSTPFGVTAYLLRLVGAAIPAALVGALAGVIGVTLGD